MIEDKKVFLVNVDTLKNSTDALTKPMSSAILVFLGSTNHNH